MIEESVEATPVTRVARDLTAFWGYVNQRSEDDCWQWLGSTSDGYGQYGTGEAGTRWAHRIAWEDANGPVGAGLVLDHLCRNRGCVNPAHLEPVTNKENILRGVSPTAINARLTECKHGHPFDDENTYYPARGGRACRTCKREVKRNTRRNQGGTPA